MRWTEQMRSYLREKYADGDNPSIAEHLGVTVRAVQSKASFLGIHKSREYESARLSRIAKEKESAWHLNTREAIAKRVETRKRMFRTERARIMFGLEQQTGIHIRTESRAKMLQRNRLQRLGYVIDDANLIAYWTPGTHRARRLERLSRGEKRGSIKCYYDFAELPENA